MSDITVKKLSEFTEATTLDDELLVPVSNTSGAGYKAKLSTVRNYVSADTGYFTCPTGASTAAKEVTATGFVLRTGGSMHIKFSNANTAASEVTLNVNLTGAKPLHLNGSPVSATNTWSAGDVMEMFYDGTNWQMTSAAAAVETRFQEVIGEIDDAKDDALDAIEEAISGLTMSYETIEGSNVQLKGSGSTPIMPASNAKVVAYDKSDSGLDADNTQDAIDVITDNLYEESDWLPGSDFLSEDLWAARRLAIDTTAMTATSAASKSGSTYYSNIMLPPSVTAIRLTLDKATTYPRELSGVPASTQKVGTNDVYGYVQSWSGSQNAMIECHVSDKRNRICIQTAATASPTAAGQLARLASLQYKKMMPAVPSLLARHTGKVLDTYTAHTTQASMTGLYANGAQTRYRPFLDVRGFRGKLKIKCAAAIQDIGMRIVGYFMDTLDYSGLAGQISYTIFENGVTECEFDNRSGQCKMILFNISTESAITSSQIAALWDSGISFEVQDMDFTQGDYPLNARKWGAAGDGTTDDTRILQHLLDIGGDIYIPSGTYKVSSMLLIGDNTHIIMEPGAILKCVTANTSGHFCMLDTRNDVNETAYNGRHDIIIEGGIIDLNGATNDGDSVGIGLQHASRILIKNVTIKGNRGHCIDMGGCKNVTIENCTFTDPQTSKLKMESLQIDGTGSYGSWPFPPYTDTDLPCFDGTPCINVEIKGCRFFQNAYSPAIGNHNGWHHKNIDIHDNLFVGPGAEAGLSRGFIAFQDGYGQETDLVLIHNNIFRDRGVGFQFQYAAKDGSAMSNIGRIYVKNNLFVNITTLVSSDSTTPARYVMDGNETITD